MAKNRTVFTSNDAREHKLIVRNSSSELRSSLIVDPFYDF